ncbi:MAG: hypothetical protein CMF96_01700 [Candidatus Marinimicrobia bacterium]|nr:hypothetical protein [Candidatus Neomarinimicrobiota bacterium]
MKIKYIIFLISILLGEDFPLTEFDFSVNIYEAENVYPEKMQFHTMNNSYLTIMDSSITNLWLVKVEEVGLDFKVNQEHLTFFQKDSSFWIVMDKNMLEIDTLRCINGLKADYHDIRLLEDGGYILQAYHDVVIDMTQNIEGGHPEAIVNELVLQEFDSNHNLIFEWYAHDYLDISLYTNLNITNSQFTWMHGNSIEIDFDNNLIISNRRSDEAIKINRHTGEVIWILGGPANQFSILNDSYYGFSKQHDIRRLINGNILVFDNGTNHNPQLSRVCEYELNTENMTAELVWEYSHPEQYVGLSMGSSQRLSNGNTLINWGNLQNSGSIITEVDYTKNIVMEIEFSLGFNIYKVRKNEWDFDINLIKGDINLDNSINIIDVLNTVQIILDTQNVLEIIELYKLDMNLDGHIDVTDLIFLINIILEE